MLALKQLKLKENFQREELYVNYAGTIVIYHITYLIGTCDRNSECAAFILCVVYHRFLCTTHSW